MVSLFGRGFDSLQLHSYEFQSLTTNGWDFFNEYGPNSRLLA